MVCQIYLVWNRFWIPQTSVQKLPYTGSKAQISFFLIAKEVLSVYKKVSSGLPKDKLDVSQQTKYAPVFRNTNTLQETSFPLKSSNRFGVDFDALNKDWVLFETIFVRQCPSTNLVHFLNCVNCEELKWSPFFLHRYKTHRQLDIIHLEK